MARELKATVINMKHLSQNIDDPIIIGAGDADGRSLRIIFTQEAAAQLTPNTKVYLSWFHQEKNIKGYNVFTEIKNEDDEDFPPTWEIYYPQSMLWEGNVLACIQLVDDVSISTSTNFMIHILSNPNDGSDFIASDDFSDFKKLIIKISCLEQQMKDQMESQKIEFEDMQLEFQQVRKHAMDAEQIAQEAKEIAEASNEAAAEALRIAEEVSSSFGDIEDQNNAMREEINVFSEKIDAQEEEIRRLKNKTEELEQNHNLDLTFYEF